MRAPRKAYAIALLAVLIGAFLAVVAVHRAMHKCIIALLKIEYSKKDAVPLLMEVSPDGSIYTLEQAGQIFYVRIYNQKGKCIWQEEHTESAVSEGVLVSFPGGKVGYAVLPDSRANHRILRVTVSRGGEAVWDGLRTDISGSVHVADATPTNNAMYMVGDIARIAENNPTAIMLDIKGSNCWIRSEKFDGSYSHVLVDRSGDMITAGFIGAGVGPFVAEYSKDGHRKWLSKMTTPDGGATVWLGTNRKDDVLAIVRLHDIIFGRDGIDNSGRNQDFVLLIYSPGGRLLKRQALSHGPEIDIVDATLSSRGEIYTVGNRKDGTGAQVMKLDAQNKFVWSSTIKLPHGCSVQQITQDNAGALYIQGYCRGGKTAPSIKAFLYKVSDSRAARK